MFIVKKRSELVRFGLFLALAGAMAWFVASRFNTWRVSQGDVAPDLNPPPSDTTPVVGAEPTGADFFADFRLERSRQRSALQASLKEVIGNPGTADDVRKEAQQQYLALSRQAAQEDTAESMLKAKGFTDVVVKISQGTAEVVVKGAGLSNEQYLQVVEMVARVTGVKQSAIHAMARE